MSLPGNESETAFDDVKIQSGSDCERAKQLFDSLQPPTSTTSKFSIRGIISKFDLETVTLVELCSVYNAIGTGLWNRSKTTFSE